MAIDNLSDTEMVINLKVDRHIRILIYAGDAFLTQNKINNNQELYNAEYIYIYLAGRKELYGHKTIDYEKMLFSKKYRSVL